MKKKLFNLVTVLVIMQACVLGGCSLFNPDHFARDQQRAQLFYLQNPGELAKVCAQEFPVKAEQLDTGKVKVISDTSTKISVKPTQINPGQIVIGPESDTVVFAHDTVTVTRTITNTRLQVDTLKLKDMAAQDSLRSSNKTLQASALASAQQLTDAKGTASSRLWIIVGLALLSLILIIVLICKTF